MKKQEKGRRYQGQYVGKRVYASPETPAAGTGTSGNRARTPAAKETQPLCREAESIRAWLKRVRFKKAALGGVDEADVWKKIGELNTLYEQALAAERMRYDALLEERIKSAARLLEQRMRAGWPEEAGDGPYE